MPNSRFRLLLILSVLLTAACQTEVREAYINQDKYIDTYVSNNFADNPVYHEGGVVRVVLVEGLAGAPVIERGDSVYLYYAGYTFGQAHPRPGRRPDRRPAGRRSPDPLLRRARIRHLRRGAGPRKHGPALRRGRGRNQKESLIR